jgi:nicotinamide-nucleotide amidase
VRIVRDRIVEVDLMDFETRWQAPVEALAQALRTRGWRLAVAESCTGGLIAAACTSVAGSSDWFERGFVTYSNEAKHELLGVPVALIAAHGAVSAEVARAMADGALAHSPADVAVAVTGIAGPGGAAPGKPVGTVWMAVARRGTPAVATLLQLQGGRGAVRDQTVAHALQAVQATTA